MHLLLMKAGLIAICVMAGAPCLTLETGWINQSTVQPESLTAVLKQWGNGDRPSFNPNCLI